MRLDVQIAIRHAKIKGVGKEPGREYVPRPALVSTRTRNVVILHHLPANLFQRCGSLTQGRESNPDGE